MLLAEIFLSAGTGDVILDLQSLTGAVGMAGMTFFLPAVFALALLPPGTMGRLETAWCHVNFWLGVGIAVAGVWTSVLDLTEDSSSSSSSSSSSYIGGDSLGGKMGEGGGQQCLLLEYTHAPHDPGDPCYISGI